MKMFISAAIMAFALSITSWTWFMSSVSAQEPDVRVVSMQVSPDKPSVGDAVEVIDDGTTVDRGEPLRVLGQPGRGRVARLAGVENLLAMTVESRNPQDGTMICAGGGIRLEIP